jgi:hypothetical protein
MSILGSGSAWAVVSCAVAAGVGLGAGSGPGWAGFDSAHAKGAPSKSAAASSQRT